MLRKETKSEADRLAALRGYRLLDTIDEPEFDAIVQEAAHALSAPIALISLIDENRQWFKARVGLEAHETPRSMSFCAYAIQGHDTMIVPDATMDDRFKDNPLVLNDPSVRFYAGTPLETEEGHRVGTLCVIDRVPRAGVSDTELAALERLAAGVMQAFEARSARQAEGGGDPSAGGKK